MPMRLCCISYPSGFYIMWIYHFVILSNNAIDQCDDNRQKSKHLNSKQYNKL